MMFIENNHPSLLLEKVNNFDTQKNLPLKYSLKNKCFITKKIIGI